MAEESFFLKTIMMVFINGKLRQPRHGVRSPEQPRPEGRPKSDFSYTARAQFMEDKKPEEGPPRN